MCSVGALGEWSAEGGGGWEELHRGLELVCVQGVEVVLVLTEPIAVCRGRAEVGKEGAERTMQARWATIAWGSHWLWWVAEVLQMMCGEAERGVVRGTPASLLWGGRCVWDAGLT